MNLIEWDIQDALDFEKMITRQGVTLKTDRVFLDTWRDRIIYVGNNAMNGTRTIIGYRISIGDMQAILMGDSSPLFAGPA